MYTHTQSLCMTGVESNCRKTKHINGGGTRGSGKVQGREHDTTYPCMKTLLEKGFYMFRIRKSKVIIGSEP